MSGILNAYSGGTYSGLPGAPTIGTATATGSTTASVAFTAPTNTGGLSITGYQVLSSPGSITATGSSSPITVTGLTASTSYTFQVRAQNSIGYGSYSGSSNSITTLVAPGSQSYTTPGCYSWVAPAGVTSVSVVAIGAPSDAYNSGGGGGGLGYKNNISVTPGSSYTVVVGTPGTGGAGSGTASYFICTATVSGCGGVYSGGLAYGGSYTGTGGGSGGSGGTNAGAYSGGGGAGGYAGSGGRGGNSSVGCGSGQAGNSGSGGGGGGGGGGASNYGGGGGGGTGLLGQGSSGTGGAGGSAGGGNGSGGAGGSGGATGTNGTGLFTPSGKGGSYGGAGGSYGGCSSRGGAVRIVYPGTTRQFPSTCVGSP